MIDSSQMPDLYWKIYNYSKKKTPDGVPLGDIQEEFGLNRTEDVLNICRALSEWGMGMIHQGRFIALS